MAQGQLTLLLHLARPSRRPGLEVAYRGFSSLSPYFALPGRPTNPPWNLCALPLLGMDLYFAHHDGQAVMCAPLYVPDPS